MARVILRVAFTLAMRLRNVFKLGISSEALGEIVQSGLQLGLDLGCELLAGADRVEDVLALVLIPSSAQTRPAMPPIDAGVRPTVN